MAIIKRRDQYEELKTVCTFRGARNFARSELFTTFEGARRPEGGLQGRLSDVDQKLSNLESKFQRMVNLLEGMASRK
jgi:hypothetical protein